MAKGAAGRGSDQFVLRFPSGMRDRVAELAKLHGRSMNSEIISMLDKAIEDGEFVEELDRRLSRLEGMVDTHHAALGLKRRHR